MARLLLLSCALLAGLTASPADARDAVAGWNRGDFREVITGAKARVFPAVIYIKCIRESMEGGRKQSEETSGSGVIIDSDGIALTNWHVIDKAVEIRCLLSDGRAMKAEVLGSDKDTDIAVLQLEPEAGERGKLPRAELGDSTAVQEGDFVMAMGAPWGLNRSVSIGIISCANRYLEQNSEYSIWLQTDAAISPGNSGGPLVDTAGKVIGLNTRGAMTGGDMGFAVPAHTVRALLPQLKAGKVNWSWTGLQLQPLRDFNRRMYFEATEGVIVAGTEPESPARRAGVKTHDRIVEVNGQPVTAVTDEQLPRLRRMLGLLPKRQPASLRIVRGDETLTLKITPREKGEVEGEELDCPRWDLTVKTINQFDNPALYFHRKQGVFIFGTKYPGNAASAGLRPQDIVLKVGASKVATLEQMQEIYDEAMANIDDEHKIKFTVLRNGLMRQVMLDFSRDYNRQ